MLSPQIGSEQLGSTHICVALIRKVQLMDLLPCMGMMNTVSWPGSMYARGNQADSFGNNVFLQARKRASKIVCRDERSLQYVFVHARRPIPATPWHVGLCPFSADFGRQ